jgi:hypothetical protein
MGECDTKVKVYTYCGQDPLNENIRVRIDLNSEVKKKLLFFFRL